MGYLRNPWIEDAIDSGLKRRTFPKNSTLLLLPWIEDAIDSGLKLLGSGHIPLRSQRPWIEDAIDSGLKLIRIGAQLRFFDFLESKTRLIADWNRRSDARIRNRLRPTLESKTRLIADWNTLRVFTPRTLSTRQPWIEDAIDSGLKQERNLLFDVKSSTLNRRRDW